jgi:hypothetical protein
MPRMTHATVFALVALLITQLFAFSVLAPRASASPATITPIPPGTILPIRLNHGFSDRSHPGSAISGRVMQSVPLPNAETIPAGATVSGTITAIQPAARGASPVVSFTFNQLEIHHQKFPISVDLRALASSMQISLAQIPEVSSGFGTPITWADTVQIGGDYVYGAGGEVTDQHDQKVGKALLDGGVLVHVKAQPGTPCREELGDSDRLQALWVFSAGACGVYGLQGVSIAHAGRTDSLGVVTLTAASRQVRVGSGAGMLLRTIN